MITRQLILTITAIVVGSSFQFGYQTGVINAPLIKIEEFIRNSSYKNGVDSLPDSTVEMISSIIVAAFPIGGLVGALVGGYLCHEFGRKLTLLISCFPTILGSVLMTIAMYINWYPSLIIGRLIIGTSCGVYTTVAPMYLSEIAPLKYKGASGTINQFVIVIGVLLSQILGLRFILGSETLWPYLLGLSIIPCLIQMVLLIFCPESPRYLLLTANNEHAARTSLSFLRSSTNIEEEIREMMQEKEASRSQDKALPFLELFKRRYLRMAVGVSIGMQLSQQLSGINAVIYYSDKIFVKAGFSDDTSNYATIGVGVVNVVVTFISVLLVDKLGRKTLHLTGMSGMFLSSLFLSLSLIFHYKVTGLIYVAMVFIFIYVAFFGIGPGAIPWFIVPEMFTQESRGHAMTIAVFTNWLGAIVIGIGFPPVMTLLGDYNFLPFTVTLFIFSIFTYVYVPETKGRTPEELENYFKRRVDGLSLNDDPLLTNASVGPMMVDDDDNDFQI